MNPHLDELGHVCRPSRSHGQAGRCTPHFLLDRSLYGNSSDRLPSAESAAPPRLRTSRLPDSHSCRDGGDEARPILDRVAVSYPSDPDGNRHLHFRTCVRPHGVLGICLRSSSISSESNDQTSARASRCIYSDRCHPLFLLSLGSKETAMTFPLALLLWDVAIRRLDGAALRNAFLSDHLPFWLVLLVAWLPGPGGTLAIPRSRSSVSVFVPSGTIC